MSAKPKCTQRRVWQAFEGIDLVTPKKGRPIIMIKSLIVLSKSDAARLEREYPRLKFVEVENRVIGKPRTSEDPLC